MTVLGVVTIGQSPRSDMVPEMMRWLPSSVEVRERGALDGLSSADLTTLAPKPADETLTTRLRDGSSVVIGRAGILPRLQAAIDILEAGGADVVLIVCTGEFPAFRHSRPLLSAGPLLAAGLSALAGDSLVGVICPLAEQEQQSYEKFAHLDQKIKVAWATPYQPGVTELEKAATELAAEGAQLLVLDCMGYTEEHRQAAAAASGLPVILSRSLVARLTAELT
ncbi:AroM family protein [Kribbella sp. NBC_00709]|uniref:AroM family protein n=1 Tax=Kribbella sp. NBC_00709 TaxID=2975972 RepID=UPI002E29D159|nr:AroM family protein [Kribbella sp. NBC_00709]